MKTLLPLFFVYLFSYKLFGINDGNLKLILPKDTHNKFTRSSAFSSLYPNLRIKHLNLLDIYIYTFSIEKIKSDFIKKQKLLPGDYLENIKLEERGTILKTEPNDPYLSLQWYLKQISALKLRDEYEKLQPRASTATYTIGIIDNGLLVDHEDLKSVLWKNIHEIENDGIDNDQNGYIDDYWGLSTEPDHILYADDIKAHGTPVSGIAAAQVDNRKGIASPNENSQLLFCGYGNGLLSDLLECYEYMAMLKKNI